MGRPHDVGLGEFLHNVGKTCICMCVCVREREREREKREKKERGEREHKQSVMLTVARSSVERTVAPRPGNTFLNSTDNITQTC